MKWAEGMSELGGGKSRERAPPGSPLFLVVFVFSREGTQSWESLSPAVKDFGYRRGCWFHLVTKYMYYQYKLNIMLRLEFIQHLHKIGFLGNVLIGKTQELMFKQYAGGDVFGLAREKMGREHTASMIYALNAQMECTFLPGFIFVSGQRSRGGTPALAFSWLKTLSQSIVD